jgi:hypothetical protein
MKRLVAAFEVASTLFSFVNVAQSEELIHSSCRLGPTNSWVAIFSILNL